MVLIVDWIYKLPPNLLNTPCSAPLILFTKRMGQVHLRIGFLACLNKPLVLITHSPFFATCARHLRIWTLVSGFRSITRLAIGLSSFASAVFSLLIVCSFCAVASLGLLYTLCSLRHSQHSRWTLFLLVKSCTLVCTSYIAPELGPGMLDSLHSGTFLVCHSFPVHRLLLLVHLSFLSIWVIWDSCLPEQQTLMGLLWFFRWVHGLHDSHPDSGLCCLRFALPGLLLYTRMGYPRFSNNGANKQRHAPPPLGTRSRSPWVRDASLGRPGCALLI